MIEFFTDPFALAITQRALIAVLLLGVLCGPLGCWVIHFRSAYAAESLSHAILPGLVVASLLSVSLLVGAAVGAVVAALAIWLAGRPRGIDTDAAVGVAVTTLLAAGVLLALAPEVPARLGELLFGDLLAVSRTDLVSTAAITLAVLAALAAFHRRLVFTAFDRATAAAFGTRPAAVEMLVLLLIAVAVICSARLLGNLLAVALLIAPALAAGRLASRLVTQMAAAAIVAAASGAIGLMLSYHLDIAAAASVALVAVGVFAVTTLVGRRPPALPGFASPIESLREGTG